MESAGLSRRPQPASFRVVTIHQPDFLPWLGFFDRWAKSDIYIVLDDVQFLRRGWHNRDKVKTPQGVQWLTIPTRKKGRYDQLIREVEIDYSSDWRYKHLETIRMSYHKAPAFDLIFPGLEEIYQTAPKMLMELNLSLLKFAASKLGIRIPTVFASDFALMTKSSLRLLDLVQTVGGTVYLTGSGSVNYLDLELFVQAQVEVVIQEYPGQVYPQLHGEFVPGLSVLDYLMMTPRPMLTWSPDGAA